MKWLVFLALLLLPVGASAQVGQLPDIGQLMYRSKDYQFLTDENCLLIYNKAGRHFACADPRLVSLSFPPTSFGLGTASPPALSMADPPYLTFTDSGNQTATLDWIMPSEALDGSSFLLTWEAAASSGSVVWLVDWCAYAAGGPPCTPSGSHQTTIMTATRGANYRTDSTINPFDPTWPPSSRIVFHITRSSTGSLVGDVKLTGVRVELTQN